MTVTLPLTETEARILQAIRVAGAFVSDVDALRAAVFHYAKHYDLEPSPDDFLIGNGQGDLFAPVEEPPA